MRLEATQGALERGLFFLPCLPEERPHRGLEFQVLQGWLPGVQTLLDEPLCVSPKGRRDYCDLTLDILVWARCTLALLCLWFSLCVLGTQSWYRAWSPGCLAGWHPVKTLKRAAASVTVQVIKQGH